MVVDNETVGGGPSNNILILKGGRGQHLSGNEEAEVLQPN